MNGEGVFLDYHSPTENGLLVKPSEFLGKKANEVLPPELAQVILEKVNRALASREIQPHEYQMQVNGKFRDFEARYTASGENEVIAIIRDITLQKESAEELRKSEERYQTLARISPVGIFRTDANGNTTYVNPTWCTISGLSAKKALGTGWLKAVHPHDRKRLGENWNASTRLHGSSLADYRFIRPDGSVVWVIGQAVPEKNPENKVVGYVGTITDITDRKHVEAALKRSITAERESFVLAKTIQAANLELSHSLDLDEILQVLLNH